MKVPRWKRKFNNTISWNKSTKSFSHVFFQSSSEKKSLKRTKVIFFQQRQKSLDVKSLPIVSSLGKGSQTYVTYLISLCASTL